MPTKLTKNGVSTTNAAGTENFETFYSAFGRKRRRMVQYDYRHINGELFSCVRPTLEEARNARNIWLKKQSN